MSPILAALIRSAFVPAAILAGVLFLAGKFGEPFRARLQVIAIALTFVIGNYLLIGRLSFPPTDGAESLSYAALLLAGFVLIYPGGKPSYFARIVMVLILGALVLFHLRNQLLGHPVHQRNLLAFFCLGLGLWSIFERNSHKVNLLTLVGLPLITAIGLSFILLFNASASYSQMVTILCAMFGAMAVLAWIFPSLLSKAAMMPFLSVFVVLIMAAGHFYLDVNPWKMIWLSIPYFVLWIRSWLPFVPKSPLLEFLALAALSLLPLGYFLYNSYVTAGPLY